LNNKLEGLISQQMLVPDTSADKLGIMTNKTSCHNIKHKTIKETNAALLFCEICS
jgi:hypothetical protein